MIVLFSPLVQQRAEGKPLMAQMHHTADEYLALFNNSADGQGK